MEFSEVLKTRRSIRKFTQQQIPDGELAELVDFARYAPAAANIQPLKYAVVNGKNACAKIFPHTKWAKLLAERGTPAPGEEPTAYIIVMSDIHKRMNSEADVAFAIENIVLAAWEKGIGSCILGSINREQIAQIINLPDGYEINYAVALGYPKQQSFAEEAAQSVAYYMDDNGDVHVPKRKLDEIMYFVD